MRDMTRTRSGAHAPDPDELLDKLQREEAKRQRGRLKVFFGASAGVGKTFAMLQAARRRRDEGVDVVIGVVETHGRKETLALCEGLETLPPVHIDYRGRTLAEFDSTARSRAGRNSSSSMNSRIRTCRVRGT